MPRLLTRRQLIALAVGGGVALGARHALHRVARAAPASGPLSNDARELIERAWLGLDPTRVIDTHVHLLGTGEGGTGCFVGPRMRSFLNPIDRLKFSIYAEASGIVDLSKADEEYLAQLMTFVSTESPHGRVLLFAFDQFHDDEGNPVREESEFYTPNDYALKLSKDHPDLFVACASIHPYRADAVSELERCVNAGAIAVKWLPNAMNIDPSNAKCDPFYQALARLHVPLITHAGEEKAVHAEQRQRLGNPLHLRHALEHGVTVVIAHCASLGQNPDLDLPANAQGERPLADNFDLFLRLMGETRWDGRLFGDISATTIATRLGAPILKILRDDALQRRLVNGSDYPIPAINIVLQTGAVEKRGLISSAERELLNEIDRHDPLLMDFVLKRTLRLHDAGREFRLADDIFMVRPELFPLLKAA